MKHIILRANRGVATGGWEVSKFDVIYIYTNTTKLVPVLHLSYLVHNYFGQNLHKNLKNSTAPTDPLASGGWFPKT